MPHQLTQTSMIAECPVTVYRDEGKQSCGLIVGKLPLMRTDAIDADSKYDEIIALALQIHENSYGRKNASSVRLSSLQLNRPTDEWAVIRRQHLCIARGMRRQQKKISWAHLCLPTPNLFSSVEKLSEFEQKTLTQLLHQFNAEGWSTYCDWIAEEMVTYLKEFKPEALDEYQLQARIEDFLHEIQSTLRMSARKSIDEAMQSEDDAGVQGNKLLSLEKVIVAGREKLKASLKIKYQLLGDIVSGIGIIEQAHPELIPLKLLAAILHELMGHQLDIPGHEHLTWGQQLLLLELLDQQLHVIPVISCDHAPERTNLVLSVRMALAELSNKFRLDDLILLSHSWNDLNRQNARAQYLRYLVIANSKVVGMHEPHLKKESSDLVENSDLLVFIPQKLRSRSDFEEEINLLIIDPNTGKCQGCTREGFHLLRRLNLG